jgi:hypothetical protein
MRSRRLSGYICVLATLLFLHLGNARAQVDWSELFPGEGSKPTAPKPRAVEPPAARPLPRVQEPAPYKVAKPKTTRSKTRQHANAKPSRRIARSSPIVQSPPEEEPEFPAAADVAVPHFDRQSKQRRYRQEPSAHEVQQAEAPRHEPEAAEPEAVASDAAAPEAAAPAAVRADASTQQEPAAVAVEPAAPRKAAPPKPERPQIAAAPVAAPPVEVAAAPVAAAPVEVASAQAHGTRDGIGTVADGDGSGALEKVGLHAGDVVSEKNMDKYKALLSPGLEWTLHYGLRMKIIAPRHIAMLKAYREATEKYSGQVKLSPDGARVLNWTAGQPFPVIDPNDPQVAYKIMWNFSYGFFVTDDSDQKNFDSDTGAIGKNRGQSVERHYIIDHLRSLNYTGRLYVDPKPNLRNPDGVRTKESIHPLIEPFDLKGVGGTFYRYIDPDRQDDSWLYLPQLRRVRRLSTAQRSDALFGQDTDPDSYYGYRGQVGWADWKFLGERTVLAVMHGIHSPVKWQDPEDWIFDEVWEPRQVYVVEGVSKLPQYAYGKRILFIDKEGYVVTHSDIYDRAGQLWKTWINDWGYRKEAIPGAKLSRYSEDMAFQNAFVMIDTQLAHATKGALPSTRTPGEECWFFNMGEKSGTTEDFFTIANLIQGGQ